MDRDRSAFVSSRPAWTTHTQNNSGLAWVYTLRLSQRDKTNRQTMFLRSAEFLLWWKWDSSVTSGVENSKLWTFRGCLVSFCCAYQGRIHTLALEADPSGLKCQVLSLKLKHFLLPQEDRGTPHGDFKSLCLECIYDLTTQPGTLHWELPLLQQKERRKLHLPCCT